jgi:hypothetical protein
MESVRITNAVFTASHVDFRPTLPSVTDVLAANFNDGSAELVPLTCYGSDGSSWPLFPDMTNGN